MKQTDRLKVAAIALPVVGVMVLGGTSLASAHGFAGLDLTEEQREIVKEARDLRKSGDTEGAQTLLDEAGIELPSREEMREMREERKAEHEAQREEVHAAIEAGDYETFSELTADGPRAELITEENFAKLQEAHELRMNGDREGAQEIMQELGFTPHKHGERGNKTE